jgi:ATP-dependent DNA helicase RecQ
LNELNNLKVIDYLPSSDTPRVTFIHARESTEAMYIDPKSIKDRKNRFQVRADAFINYVTTTNNCRSMIISSYFGEENLNSCGTCDYCRNKKKVMADEDEQENIKQYILGQLIKSNLLPIEIYNLSPDNYKQKITSTIQKLLETEVLIFDDEEKLSINNNGK